MRRRSLISLLIVAAVAVAIISPAYLSFRKAERLHERLRRFEWLLSTIDDYDIVMRRLPAAVKTDEDGNPLYSWRMTLVPYAEGAKDLIDMQAPWTAPSNHDFSQQSPRLFCDPDERDRRERMKGVISVFIGRDTPFQIKSSMRLVDVPPDTILLIEAKPNAEHWMAPGDIEIGSGPVKLQHPDDGIIVGFADGEIWHLIGAVPAEILLEFATTAPCQARDRQSSLGLFKKTTRHARAFHAR
jgi:hypothetical protein